MRVRLPLSPQPKYIFMNEINKQLAKDFTEYVFRVLKANPGMQLKQAFAIVAKMSAPRIYIKSGEYARRYINAAIKGKPIQFASPYRQAMYDELCGRYINSFSGRPPRYFDEDTFERIAKQPAPSWYREYHTLVYLFYAYQHEQLKHKPL